MAKEVPNSGARKSNSLICQSTFLALPPMRACPGRGLVSRGRCLPRSAATIRAYLLTLKSRPERRAPKGPKNGNYKHGRYTAEVAATRRWLREATQMFRDLNKGPLKARAFADRAFSQVEAAGNGISPRGASEIEWRSV